MMDSHDTIVALGTPPRPSGRGMVRLSGPDVVECLSQCFTADDSAGDWQTLRVAHVLTGTIRFKQQVPCQLLLWPTSKSYTRQPTAEIHTFGATPILEQIVALLCEQGARLADPGEFTLRAFLAGRLDLTQAEGVLGVIDARAPAELDTSLEQLAGGLSRPLHATRQQLIELLAELEAGLDFVEEDIEFISAEQLCTNLQEAQTRVLQIREQLSTRNVSVEMPRVAIVGPPNAGKSSLFNEICRRWSAKTNNPRAIVSQQAGTTRDFVSTQLNLDGVACLLVDTAGEDMSPPNVSIDREAQTMTGRQKEAADVLIHCREYENRERYSPPAVSDNGLFIWTKIDQHAPFATSDLTCSAVTGEGLDQLAAEIRSRLVSTIADRGGIIGSTALRCAESLENADQALSEAFRLAERSSGEELVAAEVRLALMEIGRVVGTVYTDDILDRIFGQFCIGK